MIVSIPTYHIESYFQPAVYRRALKKAKREYWSRFLLGEDDDDPGPQAESNRCQTALKYINPMSQNITLVFQNTHNKWAITMEDKEIIMRAKTFSKPLQSIGLEVKLGSKNTHLKIINEDVRKVLFEQLVKKVLGPTKLNFKTIRLL